VGRHARAAVGKRKEWPSKNKRSAQHRKAEPRVTVRSAKCFFGVTTLLLQVPYSPEISIVVVGPLHVGFQDEAVLTRLARRIPVQPAVRECCSTVQEESREHLASSISPAKTPNTKHQTPATHISQETKLIDTPAPAPASAAPRPRPLLAVQPLPLTPTNHIARLPP
jgi:hypothetical protein